MRTIAIVLLLLLGTTVAALGQDQSPPVDNSGKGAVLCLQGMLIATKAIAHACKWDRTPTDDVIDKALSDTNDFIIANSSRPVTLDQLNQSQANEMEKYIGADTVPGFCSHDTETSDTALVWTMHTQELAKLGALVADALSVPREPLLNPCF